MSSGLDALREERRRFSEELAALRSTANTTRSSASSVVLNYTSDWGHREIELEPSASSSLESSFLGEKNASPLRSGVSRIASLVTMGQMYLRCCR